MGEPMGENMKKFMKEFYHEAATSAEMFKANPSPTGHIPI